MEFEKTGIILYTINYKTCVKFYQDILGLKVLFDTESLTCFEFGGSYLMVEIDDEYDKEANFRERTRTCLRMNVPNVKELAIHLESKNINVNYQEFSWGTIAKFYDPDGNLCAFKDSEKFEAQIEDHKLNKE